MFAKSKPAAGWTGGEKVFERESAEAIFKVQKELKEGWTEWQKGKEHGLSQSGGHAVTRLLHQDKGSKGASTSRKDCTRTAPSCTDQPTAADPAACREYWTPSRTRKGS